MQTLDDENDCPNVEESTWERKVLQLVAVGRWQDIEDTLHKVAEASRQEWWTPKDASHAADLAFASHIVPHCAKGQLESLLTSLVERGMWESVGEVFRHWDVSDSLGQWAVLEACKYCDDTFDSTGSPITGSILPFCADEHVDSAVTTLVETRKWGIMLTMFKQHYPVSESHKQWALQEACKHWSVSFDYEKSIINSILPLCADNQRDSVLTILVERQLWDAAHFVMHWGVSDSVRRWAVLEAFRKCNDGTQLACSMLLHCAEDQLDSVATTLVERGVWSALGMVLAQGVSDRVRRWAVREACERYEEGHFPDWLYGDPFIKDEILPHIADDQVESLLEILVERRFWSAVGELLHRDTVSSPLRRWAVLEACKHCVVKQAHSSEFLINEILSHCANDQMDSVLTLLVEKRQWQAVAEVLKQDCVSAFQKQWAMLEACKHYEDFQIDTEVDEGFFINNILCHCSGDWVESVLKTFVQQHHWLPTITLLGMGVTDNFKQWAVHETCTHADEHTIYNVFSHCADDQLDSVMATLVERRFWAAVGSMFQRAVSDSVKRWALLETCKHWTDGLEKLNQFIIRSVLPHCTENQLDSVLIILVEECVWQATGQGLKLGVSDSKRRWVVHHACARADEETLLQNILEHYAYEDIQSVLKLTSSRNLWKAFLVLLQHFIIDTLHHWSGTLKEESEPDEETFWAVVRNPCEGVETVSHEIWRSVCSCEFPNCLKKRLDWDTHLCEVLFESLLEAMKEVWLTGRHNETVDQSVADLARLAVHAVHQEIKQIALESDKHSASNLRLCIQKLHDQFSDSGNRWSPFFAIYFIKHLICEYHKRRAWTQMTITILVVLTTVSVVPQIQSVALGFMLRHKRWDIITDACLSYVCEHVRRELFQAAVKQRQWNAVKQWTDHTLYDDQRWWALKEAYKEKQWEVYLLLADHGLTEVEVMHVHHQLVLFANWKVVLQSFERGSYVTEAKEVLIEKLRQLAASEISGKTQRKQPLHPIEKHKILNRIHRVVKLEKKLLKQKTNINTATNKNFKWQVALCRVVRCPEIDHRFVQKVAKEAMESKAWHVVMQLSKLAMNAAQRDSLFPEMVRQQQWCVCRALLEKGISIQLCLDALPQLMDKSQWTLVARMVEYDVHDDVRRHVMSRALERREGSVVWKCISTLGHNLSVEERKTIFHQAFHRNIWQAVKPLVEEKDVLGIRHRDIALLEAIEQHQWDVVDHCQRHHADINMRDSEGHTAAHRAARAEDWEAVKELTMRDGDPNLLDNDGLSVLHRAIRAEQWDVAKLLIQFHGDIHLAAQPPLYPTDSQTSLQMLITARQVEVIESTLMWCPDQWKGVNAKRETTLHAACASGWPSILYHLIARKVDPLVVTGTGKSALCYAVLCKDIPHETVAECIRLGFSTHQPHLLKPKRRYPGKPQDVFRSPLALALMRGLPRVTQMLYESGACSSSQLSEMNHHLHELTMERFHFQYEFERLWYDVNPMCSVISADENKELNWEGTIRGVRLVDFTKESQVHPIRPSSWVPPSWEMYGFQRPSYLFDVAFMKESASFLRQMSSTPRSLQSTCRLMISRCLTLSKTRHGDIAQLPLSRMMKKYLMFSDLSDLCLKEDADLAQREVVCESDQSDEEECYDF
ncbi:uncharacterized protein [Littorina saxatilis]|uniref:uncharacterized protein n=1 Tax=Littorina saxatilis TaxID=31220 RepID=UPI0038B5AB08